MTPSLKGYLRDVRNAVLRRTPARRDLTALPDDIFLTSYPKSGNTWLRFMIGNLVFPEPVTFSNVETKLPDIYRCSNRALLQTARPRILKSHEAFDARYPRVIYVVRDPRDVAVSKYRWSIKWGMSESIPMEEYVQGLIRGQQDIATEHTAWGDHVVSWLAMRGYREDFLLVRYEDVQSRPREELARVARFLGVEPAPQRLERAIELSSAERMRKLEQVESEKWSVTRNTPRKDLPFVGTARAGGWRSTLPEAALAGVEAAWWPIMKALRYEPVTAVSTANSAPLVDPLICEALAIRQIARDRTAHVGAAGGVAEGARG
jgi:Sulfotransferase domain